MMDIFVLSVSG